MGCLYKSYGMVRGERVKMLMPFTTLLTSEWWQVASSDLYF